MKAGTAYKLGEDHRLGAIAQLGERVTGSHEVAGSSPASSISANPKVVGANRFRNHFGRYMERAAAGGVFQVTRHGKPFVRITPAELQLDAISD